MSFNGPCNVRHNKANKTCSLVQFIPAMFWYYHKLLRFPLLRISNEQLSGHEGQIKRKYFQLNQPTRYSKFSSLSLVIWIQLNIFRASSCPSSGATTTAVAASVLPSELGDSSAVGRGRAGRPDHGLKHCYHQAPTVN